MNLVGVVSLLLPLAVLGSAARKDAIIGGAAESGPARRILRELEDFAVVKGLKCRSKEDSWMVIDDVENLKGCIEECADRKACHLAQYNRAAASCVLWKKNKCYHATEDPPEGAEIEDFTLIGVPSKKLKNFFKVPKAQTHDYGHYCSGPVWKTKDIPLKRCQSLCKKWKKCAAFERVSYGYGDWGCDFYKKCDAASEYYEGGYLYVKANYNP